MPSRFTYGEPDLDFVEFDIDARQTWTDANDVTEHAVEGGSDISDNIRRKSTEYAVDGVVSNSPALTEALLEVEPENRAELAYFLLLDVMGRTVTVDTPTRSAENMAFLSVGVTRESDAGDALRIAASFRQIVTAESETVSAPVTAIERSKSEKDGGRQESTAATDEQAAAADESLATAGVELVAGLF